MMKKYDEDDLGLPQSPIYSNYPKHLWKAYRKAHTRYGLLLSPKMSRDNTDGQQAPQGELPPTIIKP